MNTLRFERFSILFWRVWVMLCLFLLSFLPQAIVQSAAADGTFQDFNAPRTGTAYEFNPNSPVPAVLIRGGPADTLNKLRLASGRLPAHQNSISFNRSAVGAFDQIIADFDFRLARGTGRADGFGVTLLNTNVPAYGTSGFVLPQDVAEEPNYVASLGIGFDIYQSGSPAEVSDNHISIHFNGTRIQDFDLPSELDLAIGRWIHARIIMRPGGGFSDVSVILNQCGMPSHTVVNQFKVPGFTPYESRVHLAARSGGQTADHEFDNIRVNYLGLQENVIAVQNGCETVVETGGPHQVTITRTGNTNGTASVRYTTADLSASAPSDYGSISGTVTFSAGQSTKTLNLPIVNDSATEKDEGFLLHLRDPFTGAVLAGPAVVKVTIVDDETAQAMGHWSDLIPSDVVAIHMHLLPTGKVLYWDRHDELNRWDGGPRLWDPVTGTIELAGDIPYDVFCSGHSFLADGRLLVTGGHIDDGMGERKASIYDPFTGAWKSIPDMNAGRWYPSNVTLANGDTLVLAGTDEVTHLNTLPQIWQDGIGTWGNLTSARIAGFPQYADYYPFLFLAPNGKVFSAGPQQWARYLDPSGTGQWQDVAPNHMPAPEHYRDYGSSVMYEDGKVLIVGGSDRLTFTPTNSAEIIDLNDPHPQWNHTIAPMHSARRHLNTTLLPDGKVLVTGGSETQGFNDSSGAVLEAELWDPETQTWTEMAAQARYRGYHSAALLLPDGRVLVGGGGHPDPVSGPEQSFEVYSPPYLFKGARPTIASAPGRAAYGEEFLLRTPNAATIAQVTLVRLSSVTHSFNENQRFKRLTFAPASGGLRVTIPNDPNLLPPGYYMLFILNGSGVPSVAHMIQVSNNVTVSIGGAKAGDVNVPPQGGQRVAYRINNGPVQMVSNVRMVPSERVIYKLNGIGTSYTEIVALPDKQLDNAYWLPWYNNKDLDTQLRIGNVSSSTATVRVYIGGQEMPGGPIQLPAGASIRKSFPGINNGPVQIVSTQNIVAAQRIIFKVNGTNASFSEMIAMPNSQLNTTYWLPWYNNKDLDTQLRFANATSTAATVRVYIGRQEMPGSPFTLPPNASIRKSFAINNGPVRIASTQKIVVSERVIYKVSGIGTSFAEMMALPNSQLDTTYWLPWYNNVELDTQLRIANTGNTPASVHIYIGGQEMLGSPFTLPGTGSIRKSFAGVNNGPVQIVSNLPIVVAERVIYRVGNVDTSFIEMMALPNSQLDTIYWLPWYNNIDLDTQLRLSAP